MPSTTVPRTGPGSDGPPRIALAPDGAPQWMADAIVAGGGHVVPLADAEALVWAAPHDPAALEAALTEAPHLTWVQLPFAGIEVFSDLLDEKPHLLRRLQREH